MRHYDFRGSEVPVETRGSSAETLVFLPGLGVHPAHYSEGLDALAERFRVLAPDLSFRSRRPLPRTTDGYLELVSALAHEMAPDGVWVGHSFGALLALIGDRPAIALAPSVPAEVGLPRMFGRAVHQQLREYAGLEGRRGVVFAARIMVEYVGAAALRPGDLFPAIRSLEAPPEAFPVRASPAVAFVCERDELYREREIRAYLDRADAAIEEIRVGECHDWPVLRPRLLADRVGEAFDRVRDGM